MATVLVTGGTGHLGRDIVARLMAQGDRVRVLARNPGTDPSIEWIRGDLGTGTGIARAVAGVDAIVHAATNSPAAQRGGLRPGDFTHSPSDVDVTGTGELLAQAGRAGVSHFVHISIVGVQQARVPYSRIKAAAENLVRQGPVPWSIVAATPFYWLAARMMDTMANRRLWPLPSNVYWQPVDSTEFADYVVECLDEGPQGRRDDFAGPQILTLVDMAHQYQSARGIRRRIVGVPLPGFAVRAMGPGTSPHGRRGKVTWSEWLAG
jgi:uncharacterized protein YbjT (DUF2867 family)